MNPLYIKLPFGFRIFLQFKVSRLKRWKVLTSKRALYSYTLELENKRAYQDSLLRYDVSTSRKR
jgi:hypothetical protein